VEKPVKKTNLTTLPQRFIDFHHRYRGHFDSKNTLSFCFCVKLSEGAHAGHPKKHGTHGRTPVIGGAKCDDQRFSPMLPGGLNGTVKRCRINVAQRGHQLLGGDESCLLLDESGFEKKGEHSVGVARQWNGRLGQVDNCQVGVFAALGRGTRATLIDYRTLSAGEDGAKTASRAAKMAGIPEAFHLSKHKSNWPWTWSDINANKVFQFGLGGC